jgi:hypothetical protein
MPQCTRCGSYEPNRYCDVCSPMDEEHSHKCQCPACREDREAARADYERDCMIDRQMESERDAFSGANSEP